jgi:polar amino acid transport system substrate-binding protein
MKIKNLITLILLASFSFAANATDKIRWIAQNYAPYSYVDKNGKNSGIAVDLAMLIIDKMNLSDNPQNIELTQLTKFFILRNDDANTAFFPIVQTANRADKFKWVGPIAASNPVLIAKKKDNIKINNPNELSSYSIGVINKYYAIAKLVELGANNNSFMEVENDNNNIKKLNNGGVNMALCDELSCNFEIKSLNLKADEFEVVYRLNGNDSFYYAFSTDTEDSLITKITNALNSIKTSKNRKPSEYNKIMSKYTN